MEAASDNYLISCDFQLKQRALLWQEITLSSAGIGYKNHHFGHPFVVFKKSMKNKLNSWVTQIV